MRNRMLKAAVRLHDCNGNFLYCISHAQGNEMVNAGTAVAVRDFSYGVSRVKRYQETDGATASSSRPTTTMLNARDAMAIAGCYGRSRTARLPEVDTRGRDSKHARELAADAKMPPEDAVERRQNKFAMWQRVPLWNARRIAWG